MIRDAEILSQLTDTIARFVRERLVPAEQQVAESDTIPDDIVADMKAMGLFGLSIPEELGGLGLTMEEEVMVAPPPRFAPSWAPTMALAPKAS